jgi:hypothetical protein
MGAGYGASWRAPSEPTATHGRPGASVHGRRMQIVTTRRRPSPVFPAARKEPQSGEPLSLLVPNRPINVSTWLGKTTWQRFDGSINRWHRVEAKRAFKRHPPDHDIVYNIADVHLDEYDPDSPSRRANRKTERRVRADIALRQIAVKATSRNKKSTMAKPWLVFTVAWQSKGVLWTLPYHYELLQGGQFTPLWHVRAMKRILRSLGIVPTAHLLDRFYAADDARKEMLSWGWRFRVRYPIGETHSRLLREPGKQTRHLVDLVKETPGHPTARRVLGWNRITRCPTLEFQRTVQVVFPGDDKPTTLAIAARARRSNRKARWEVILEESIAIACDSGEDAYRLLRDYGWRWCTEVWFRTLIHAHPSHAPKTIPSYVAGFLGHATHIALAYTNMQNHRAAVSNAPRHLALQWTIEDAASEALGIDPFQAPFEIIE